MVRTLAWPPPPLLTPLDVYVLPKPPEVELREQSSEQIMTSELNATNNKALSTETASHNPVKIKGIKMSGMDTKHMGTR